MYIVSELVLQNEQNAAITKNCIVRSKFIITFHAHHRKIHNFGTVTRAFHRVAQKLHFHYCAISKMKDLFRKKK